MIKGFNGSEEWMFIADGANFVDEMESIYTYDKLSRNILIVLPESFEWLVMKLLPHDISLEDKLNHTYKYIEYSKYRTWEQYYTELIKTLVPEYTKGNKLDADRLILIDRNKIQEYFNKVDFSLIENEEQYFGKTFWYTQEDKDQ
jgi:hypothetical protein